MNDIHKAITILKNGGIVIYPTDTGFGIGCRLDNKEAVEKLFNIRKRPTNKATPVLVSSIEMAQDYLLPLTEDVEKLMKKYWPGGLTVVYPCRIEKIPELARGGGQTLGVRTPNHSIALTLIQKVGIPLLGSSANFAGEPPPFSYESIDPKLSILVDYSLTGEVQNSTPSTVVDCTQKPWKILRQGPIDLSDDL